MAAYDLVPGTLRWLVPAAPVSPPVANRDFLFVEQHGKLTALRTSDGSVGWDVPLPSMLTVPLSAANGWLFAVMDDTLFAYRAVDGMAVWQRQIGRVRAAPVPGTDSVYLSLENGQVASIDLMRGDVGWQMKIGGKPNEILAIDDQLFVGSTDNYLYCLKARDGEIDWRKRTGADIVSRAVADKDNVYFVSLDNVLRSLNRGHGVQQWMRGLPFRPAWNPIIALDAVVVAGLTLPPRGYFLKTGAPADVLTSGQSGDIAAPLHTFASTMGFGPIVVLVTRLPSGEAVVTATSRTIEPPPSNGLGGPLPNATPVASTLAAPNAAPAR